MRIRDYEPTTDAAFVIEISCRVRMPVLYRARGLTDEDDVNRLPWCDWRYAYGHLVEAWLAGGRCVVVDAGDSTYLGFAIVADDQVKMVYVKPDFRGDKLGLQMLDALHNRQPYCPTASWRAWEKTWPRL